MSRTSAWKPAVVLLVVIQALWTSGRIADAQAPQQLRAPDWAPQAPPLPPPQGRVIDVTSVEDLFRAAEVVRPGETIRIAEGHYFLPRYFEIKTDDVTVRGTSGDRTRVILDGARSRHGELFGFSACSGVTVADLTIQNIRWNGFKLNSDTGVHRITIRNCVIRNIWQRGVKAVRARERKCRDCVVEYCLFTNDRPKQRSDDPDDQFGGNYVGGIDAMDAVGWRIRDNVFVGIRGRTGEGPGAIFLWHESQSCVVERNIIVDCDLGISLGNAYKPDDVRDHCTDCLARNNMITRASEQAIHAAYSSGCSILHNSIHDPRNRRGRSIRTVASNPDLRIENNLIGGFPIRCEPPDGIRLLGNVVGDPTGWFVAPDEGNLRLRGPVPGIVDAAGPVPEVVEDIDRRPRGPEPDVGADEWGNTRPASSAAP